MNNNDKYDLSLCTVSSFIEKNTTPGVYKFYIFIFYISIIFCNEYYYSTNQLSIHVQFDLISMIVKVL